MELEQSSLYREVTAIVSSSSKPVHFTYDAQIHVNGETYNVIKVLSLDNLQDYEDKYADETIITVTVPGGTYAKRIYPFKDAIDITVFRRPIGEVYDSSNMAGAIETERYTATLIDTGNPLLEANGMNAVSEEAMNLTNIFEVSFQLVNKALEQARLMTTGGIYRNAKVEDVIKGLLTASMDKLVVEGSRKPKGVDMVEASNKQARDHIIIPHGTRVVDIPEYVHRKCGGVYSAGMGYYLQGDYWYIYPCYDTTRYAKATRALTIINVPKNKLPSIERTYRQDGKNVVILATGEVRFRDDSEIQQLNFGNGIRFADANNFMDGFVKIENNKATALRGKNNSEFVSSSRKNGNNNIQLSDNPINANPYTEYSKMARRQGSVLSLVWENSLPSLLTPGVMIKMLYLDEDTIKELYGVLLKVHHFTHMTGNGALDTRYSTQSNLVVFVQRLKD